MVTKRKAEDHRILIIGAGVTGLASAYALQRRGFSVTVLDRGPMPNPLASSYDRHRLIRPHYPDRPVYARRIREAFAAWEALETALGEQIYVETGVISVSLEAGDWSDRARDVMDAVGEPYHLLTPAEFETRYPHFTIPDMRWCLLTDRGGALLADRILAGYLRLLRAGGATLVPHAEVTDIDLVRASVTTSDGRNFEADRLIIAPGVGAPRLFGPHVAARVEPRRTVLAYVEPPARWAAEWAKSPSWVDLGSATEYWGIRPVADIAIKFGLEAIDPLGDPMEPRVYRDSEITNVMETYRARVRDLDDYRLVTGHCNWWTVAPEERFVFEKAENAYFLSACSGHGFKFGALTGEDVASAVADEAPFTEVASRLAAFSH